MTRQTYLLRKSGRYHFRRRFSPAAQEISPISIALGTADPVEARNLAHRLAAVWDNVAMQLGDTFERGTLTLEEQRTLFRQALQEELAHATRSEPGRQNPKIAESGHRKVIIAAYRIVGALRHDAKTIPGEAIDQVLDESWTPEERRLLNNTLRFWITPTLVTQTQVDDALAGMGAPVNDATRSEARWEIFRGRIEAQKRCELVNHALFVDREIQRSISWMMT